MGQEIGHSRFGAEDFVQFGARLREETALLGEWLAAGSLSTRHGIGGFELEAWLVDGQGRPAPVNEQFLARMNDTLVSPELSRFNIELNSTPQALEGGALGRFHAELDANWARCRTAAAAVGAELVMIGTLPTLQEGELTLANMSRSERYRALNEQVLRLRGGRPLVLDIQGMEHLHTEHGDVMLEAATTSFQIHLQTDGRLAPRYYNAMLALSAPLLAVGTNSPFLFGRRLWRETRIPLFEQAVAVGGIAGAAFGPLRRVSFGSGYVRHSLLELFRENADHFPVMLPVALEEPRAALPHLRLQNGTIWRWVRPLVGFDADGTPHLRLEQRVLPAGPTVADSIANAAFCYGLVEALVHEAGAPLEGRLEFAQVRENFYNAAKHGLQAPVTWLDGHHGPMHALLREVLLPAARSGLARLGIDAADSEGYLGIIAGRLANGQTGAEWQIRFHQAHPGDFAALVAAYRERQEQGAPVHQWSLA